MDNVDMEKFIKREKTAFIWVNAGILICMVICGLWFYTPLLDGLKRPCVIHDVLHLYCPGCGGTRAVELLLTFHPIQSFLYHPFVLFVAVLLVEYYIGAVITLIVRNGKRYYYMRDWLCYVGVGVLLGNWIIRNVLLITLHIDYIGDLVQFWNLVGFWN